MHMANIGATKQAGFSLIELMIALAIVAILSGIALPSYQSYVKRGQRTELRTQMYQAAQYLTRFYAANDSYEKTRNGDSVSIPDNLKISPPSGTQLYQLDTTNSTFGSTTYKLVYEPINGMSGDACGKFTLDSTGLKSNTDNTKSTTDCWR